jgi:hypothetical protein
MSRHSCSSFTVTMPPSPPVVMILSWQNDHAPTWPIETIGRVLKWEQGKTAKGTPIAILSVESEHYTGQAISRDYKNPLLKSGLERDEGSPEEEPTFSGEGPALLMSLAKTGPYILIEKLSEVAGDAETF